MTDRPAVLLLDTERSSVQVRSAGVVRTLARAQQNPGGTSLLAVVECDDSGEGSLPALEEEGEAADSSAHGLLAAQDLFDLAAQVLHVNAVFGRA